MRGICFEIVKYPNDAFNADETALEIDYPSEAEYFEELFSEERERAIVRTFSKYATLEKVSAPEPSNGEPLFKVTFDKDIKKKYFESSFKEFKEKAEALNFEDFSSGLGVYDISRLLDDVWADASYSALDGFDTFDNFMRGVDPDKEYYIGGIFLMK